MSTEAVEAFKGVEILPGVGKLAGKVSVDRCRLVLTNLAHRARPHAEHGGALTAWPSVPTIAADEKLPETSVRAALRILEDQRLITALTGGKGGRSRSTVYQLNPAGTYRLSSGGNPADTCRVSDEETRQVSTRNPAGVDAKPGRHLPPNTRTTNEVSGGGEADASAEASPSAEAVSPEVVKRFLARLNENVTDKKHRVVELPGMATELARITELGWWGDDLVAELINDWPKIRSSASGFVLKRLQETQAPDLDATATGGAQRIADDLRTLEACRHDDAGGERDGRHLEAFLADIAPAWAGFDFADPTDPYADADADHPVDRRRHRCPPRPSHRAGRPRPRPRLPRQPPRDAMNDPIQIDRQHLASVTAIARRAIRTDDEAATVANARRLTRTVGTPWTGPGAVDPMDNDRGDR